MTSAAAIPDNRFGFNLIHLSPTIGTEVHGIDLAEELSDDTVAWLSSLLVERKVLFFRDQDLSTEQHIAFSRRFGELEVHPFSPCKEGYPEVMELSNDQERPPRINIWHSDVTWRQAPSLGSILRAREVPEVGGDTLFADMEAAYNNLSDDTKARIDGLYAIHDNQGFLNRMRQAGASERDVEARAREFPPQRHPVVRTHPVSGRKSIYVNAAFTRRIDGLPDDESDSLLQELYRQAWIPDVQCRFRWRKNSLAFWDNRSSQHYAAADYFPETRRMERLTIIGDRPV